MLMWLDGDSQNCECYFLHHRSFVRLQLIKRMTKKKKKEIDALSWSRRIWKKNMNIKQSTNQKLTLFLIISLFLSLRYSNFLFDFFRDLRHTSSPSVSHTFEDRSIVSFVNWRSNFSLTDPHRFKNGAPFGNKKTHKENEKKKCVEACEYLIEVQWLNSNKLFFHLMSNNEHRSIAKDPYHLFDMEINVRIGSYFNTYSLYNGFSRRSCRRRCKSFIKESIEKEQS